MKVECEDLGDLKVRLKVELDGDAFQKEKKRIARAYSAHVTIKGFRPGKAPIEMVMRNIGSSLDGEVREELVKKSFTEALDEKSLKPSVEPKLELGEIAEDGGFEYSAEFECMPSVEPIDYLGVEIEEPSLPEINDGDVDNGLERMRNAAATWEDKEKDSVGHEGDMASCSLSVKAGGADEVLFEDDDMRLVVGMADFPVDGMGRELLGMKVGDEKTVSGVLSKGAVPAAAQDGEDDKTPRKADVTVTIKGLQSKHLPELDDEFAKRFSGGLTLDKWKAKVKLELKKGREKSLKEMREDAVITAVLEINRMEIGQATIDRLAKEAENAAKARMLPSMPQEERDKLDLGLPREETEAQARRNLSRQIVLQAIAEKEDVEVTDEDFEAKLTEISEEMDIPLPKVKSMVKGEEAEQLRTRMRIDKTMDFLQRYAVVKAEEEKEDSQASEAKEAETGGKEGDRPVEAEDKGQDGEESQ